MVIETFNLTKTYPSGGGCRDITISIGEGEVFGLLGPNGAGKSTFIKTLLGLLHPTSGEALVLGRPLGDLVARRQMGFLPENFRFHDWMTGQELLRFHANLYGLTPEQARKRIPEVLELVNLKGVEKRRVAAFSKGMQQRIGLAAALLPRPRLLFLDEPTSALDPIGRKEVREIITRLRDDGTTVFLNSHLLSEVEMVCQRVAIIRSGQVVTVGPVSGLLADRVEVEMVVENIQDNLVQQLTSLVKTFQAEGKRLIVTLDSEDAIPLLAETVVSQGGRLFAIIPRKHSLEEVFMELMGEEGENG